MPDMQVNINYAEIIGNKEIQLAALRIALAQKDERIQQLEQRIDDLLAKRVDDNGDE